MDYGLLFLIYGSGIKPERKLCWLRINASVISHMVYPNVVGLYQYLVLLVSGFILHNQLHYRICLNDFRYGIRF